MPASALCERVVRVVGEQAPRLEILDRDLTLGADGRADLIGLDPDGRLVLVVVAELGDEELFLTAIAALAFARSHHVAIARHSHARGWREELDPRVVVIASEFERSVIARFGTLDPSAVSCFELRSIETRRGRGESLVPIGRAARAGPGSTEGVPASLAERTARRLARIDGELARSVEGVTVHWHWRDQALCSVAREGEALRAFVAGEPRPFVMNVENECGPFLDAVARRYLELVPPPAARESSLISPAREIAGTSLTVLRGVP